MLSTVVAITIIVICAMGSRRPDAMEDGKMENIFDGCLFFCLLFFCLGRRGEERISGWERIMKAILQWLLFAQFLFLLVWNVLFGYVRQYVCSCIHCAVSMAAAFQVVFWRHYVVALLFYSLNLLGKWS